MGEEKDLRPGDEPEEVRTSQSDEEEDVEGHVRGTLRSDEPDSDDPDVEGHVRV